MSIVATLNRRPLASFPDLFTTLAVPAIPDLAGTYQGTFTGPGWVRALAGPALVLGRLPGWCGKWFDDEGQGTNLLCRGEQIRRAVPIYLERRPSLIDGREGVSVVYPDSSPWPLANLVDELRWLEADMLLGMTMFNRFGLQRFAFPFLLRRDEGHQ